MTKSNIQCFREWQYSMNIKLKPTFLDEKEQYKDQRKRNKKLLKNSKYDT